AAAAPSAAIVLQDVQAGSGVRRATRSSPVASAPELLDARGAAMPARMNDWSGQGGCPGPPHEPAWLGDISAAPETGSLARASGRPPSMATATRPSAAAPVVNGRLTKRAN